MTFDIIKLIIFRANSSYFIYNVASQNFAMVGTVGFISGYESLWTLLLIFIVTIPCNIEAAVQLLYNLIYKRYSDSFAMLYVTGFSHKIFRAAFSELSIWQKGFTIITGILILIIMIMAEQYASGLVARLVWPEQKENAFNDLVLTSKADAEQEDDVTMQISWTRKNNYYYSSESAVDDEDVDEKETQEFEWRELAHERDKPVGVIQYRKRMRMSDS